MRILINEASARERVAYRKSAPFDIHLKQAALHCPRFVHRAPANALVRNVPDGLDSTRQLGAV